MKNTVLASFATLFLVASAASAAQIASTQYVDNRTGDLAALTTTQKTTLVGAVNELKGVLGNVTNAQLLSFITESIADAKYAGIATESVASGAATNATTALGNIGNLASMGTAHKATIVGAINEIKGLVDGLGGGDLSGLLTQAIADELYETKGAAAAAAVTALADAKIYADANDANTTYTAGANVQITNGVISATDTNTVYNDTALVGRVSDVEGEITGLAQAIQGKVDASAIAGMLTQTVADARYDAAGAAAAVQVNFDAFTGRAAGFATAAQGAAADAAMPKPGVECATQQCVLSSDSTGKFEWSVVAL